MHVAAALYAIAILVLTLYGGNLLWMAFAHARADRRTEGPVPDPAFIPDRR